MKNIENLIICIIFNILLMFGFIIYSVIGLETKEIFNFGFIIMTVLTIFNNILLIILLVKENFFKQNNIKDLFFPLLSKIDFEKKQTISVKKGKKEIFKIEIREPEEQAEISFNNKKQKNKTN